MSVFQTSFASEVTRAVTLMCDALATSDPNKRRVNLKAADLALGRAMNHAEVPDESGMVTKLTQHLEDMKGREG